MATFQDTIRARNKLESTVAQFKDQVRHLDLPASLVKSHVKNIKAAGRPMVVSKAALKLCLDYKEAHPDGAAVVPTAARDGLTETLDSLRPDDTLAVWKLDRLGRSLKHLIEVVTDGRFQGQSPSC